MGRLLINVVVVVAGVVVEVVGFFFLFFVLLLFFLSLLFIITFLIWCPTTKQLNNTFLTMLRCNEKEYRFVFLVQGQKR